jgi:hypothetical protein
VELPTLEVSSPERAIFVGEDSVLLAGQATAGTAPLTSLTLNDEPIDLAADGSFSHRFTPEPGIAILGLRLEDEGGERAVDGRAVYAGPTHDPGAWLPDALKLELGPELLDDDSPDVDDLAAIVELVLEDGALMDSIIGTDFETEYAMFTPTLARIGPVDADIVPMAGALGVELVLHDVWMDFDVEVFGVSTIGSAWADSATLDMNLTMSQVGGEILVVANNVACELAGFGVTVDWFPDSLEGFLSEWAQGLVEEKVVEVAETSVAELVAGYLQAVAMDFEFSDGMYLFLDLSRLSVAPSGLRLTLNASVEAPNNISMPPNAGSLATPAAGPGWPLADGHLGMALDDDLVNQLFFGFWSSGLLSENTMDGVMVGALSGQGGGVPAPLGPLDELSVRVDLPLVVLSATSSEMDADVAIGEMRMVFIREDQERIDVSVNMRGGASFGFNEDGELTFDLDNRPAELMIHVGVLEHPEGIDPGDLAALVKLVVPPLLGNASMFAPGFSLPDMDLGELTGLTSLSGVVLAIEEPEVQVGAGNWVQLTAQASAE